MDHREITRRFNGSAGRAFDVRLIGGAAEPLYLPARDGRPAEIHFTRDYAQSALHELAHWCIAGAQRRALTDYGYWYQPPPRKPMDQARFFAAEVRTQGLEYLLAGVAGVRFHVSVDDPGRELGGFLECVQAAAADWLGRGFTARTAAVFAALDPGWRGALETMRQDGQVPGADRRSASAR